MVNKKEIIASPRNATFDKPQKVNKRDTGVKEDKIDKNGRVNNGRGPIQLNEDEIIKMGEIGLNYRSIAYIVGVSERTIRDRFADLIEMGKHLTVRKLNTKAIEMALSGNTVMMIWVMKNVCGWTDVAQIPQNQMLTVLKQTFTTNKKGEVEIITDQKEIEPS